MFPDFDCPNIPDSEAFMIEYLRRLRAYREIPEDQRAYIEVQETVGYTWAHSHLVPDWNSTTT
jgi:hypothetical protein